MWNLFEQNRCLRRGFIGGIAKRLPHVHHGQADAPVLLAKPLIELGHAGFRAVLAAEPDRPQTNEIADHDPIIMALADRHLVDTDHRRPWRSGLGELRAHILLVEFLDRVPVQLERLGNIPDRRAPTAPADVKGKSLAVERVVRQELQTLALHLATTAAIDASHLELKEYAHAAAGKIARAAELAIVPARTHLPTSAAGRFFDRRTSVMTRACGSAKIPRTCSTGRKPGNLYASRKRRRFVEVARIASRIATNGRGASCPIRHQNPRTVQSAKSPYPHGCRCCKTPGIHPHESAKTQKFSHPVSSMTSQRRAVAGGRR